MRFDNIWHLLNNLRNNNLLFHVQFMWILISLFHRRLSFVFWSHMVSSMSFIMKHLSTVATLVWFFSRMLSLMNSHVCWVFKCFITVNWFRSIYQLILWIIIGNKFSNRINEHSTMKVFFEFEIHFLYLCGNTWMILYWFRQQFLILLLLPVYLFLF